MPEPSTRDELDAAMVRLADGDRGAIDTVYRALWPVVVRYCAAFVGDEAEAEDLAQRALIKMFEQAHDYDRDKRAKTWALTIAAWECRTYRRKRQRTAKNIDTMTHTQTRDSSPNVEQEAWKRQAVDALEGIVGSMSESDQQALTDSFVKGLSEPSHRKRKQRVLARLRRRWKEIYGDD
ncbi:MAG: sigma-70 family RNA polymerase sigma factor [Polyangiales bacterium]